MTETIRNMVEIITTDENGVWRSTETIRLGWSKNAPTSPGVYQAVDMMANNRSEPLIRWVRVFQYAPGGFLCELFGTDETFELSDFTEWLGPFPISGEKP